MKPIRFILFLTTIIILLSVVQVVVSNRLSTTGVALGKINEEIYQVKTENAKLSRDVLFMTSLTNISSAASSMGFVETKSHLVLSTGLPIALKQ